MKERAGNPKKFGPRFLVVVVVVVVQVTTVLPLRSWLWLWFTETFRVANQSGRLLRPRPPSSTTEHPISGICLFRDLLTPSTCPNFRQFVFTFVWFGRII